MPSNTSTLQPCRRQTLHWDTISTSCRYCRLFNHRQIGLINCTEQTHKQHLQASARFTIPALHQIQAQRGDTLCRHPARHCRLTQEQAAPLVTWRSICPQRQADPRVRVSLYGKLIDGASYGLKFFSKVRANSSSPSWLFACGVFSTISGSMPLHTSWQPSPAQLPLGVSK